MPVQLTTVDSFNKAVQAPQLSVVHFAADFIEQCGQVNDVLDALAQRSEYSQVKFYKCDAEELSEVSLAHQIEAAPTVILFSNGKAIGRIDGADPAKITEKIKEHAGATGAGDTAKNLDERLKQLVNKAPVMLFMKGDRNQPRCGFSRQIIEILNESGVPYETFDILGDEEVRQGLKVFSDWPTYPQLYARGDLIGGLDIVKEMKAAGELDSVLKG